MVEFEQMLDRLGSAAITHECRFVMVAGDLLDHRHPTPTMLRLVTAFCARMEANGITVLIVPGNHDGAAAIGVEQSHTFYWLQALNLVNVRVYTRPTIETFDDELTVVAMPYPHRRAFDVQEPLVPADLPEDRVIEAGRRMEHLIRAYGREARDSEPAKSPPMLVFLGHMTVLGSRTASEALMRMEWDIAVEPSAFEDYDFVALGHIHKVQGVGEKYDHIRHPVTQERQEKIWYPGSPVFLDFSEAKQPKGFLLVDLTAQEAGVIPVRSDPRPMVRVRLAYEPMLANIPLGDLRTFRDAIVELTITGTTRPSEQWVSQTERAFHRAGVHILRTKVDIQDEAIESVTEDEEDLTDKEAALTKYLHSRQLPDEPYLTAGRALIEARR
jgi:exonuclease SbcD